jgi:hypothetical protein
MFAERCLKSLFCFRSGGGGVAAETARVLDSLRLWQCADHIASPPLCFSASKLSQSRIVNQCSSRFFCSSPLSQCRTSRKCHTNCWLNCPVANSRTWSASVTISISKHGNSSGRRLSGWVRPRSGCGLARMCLQTSLQQSKKGTHRRDGVFALTASSSV